MGEQQRELEMLRDKVDRLESAQKAQNARIDALETLLRNGQQKRSIDPSFSDNSTIPPVTIDIDSLALMMNRSQSRSQSQTQPKRHESAFTLRGISGSSLGDLMKLSAFDKKFLQGALLGSSEAGEAGGRQASAEIPKSLNIDLDSVTPL